MPKWHWRTFPVYFAFALGGFVGLYMAIIAQAASDEGNDIGWLLAFGFWAILLGFGLSRITSRWLISHNWGPAARRARKR